MPAWLETQRERPVLDSQYLEPHLRTAQRQLEQLSGAAERFSLQLDIRKLFQDIAVQASEILRPERTNVYSAIDDELAFEASQPAVAQAELPSGEVDWSRRFLLPKLENGIATGDVRRRSVLCVPLIGTQNRVLGVIEFINKRTGGFFHEQDLRTALCLARIATTAVDRARLFDRIEQWTRSMETLLSFNATVNQHLEPQEMVHQLVANVTGFLDADGGAAGIIFQSESKAVAECTSLYFGGKWYPFERQWQRKEGIPGMMLEAEFPFLVNDYPTNALSDRMLVEEFRVRSCICVPIKNAAEKMLGFFKLHRVAGKPDFTWQDAAFLESLGNTAAVAIENARLVQSLDRTNQQLKNLSEAHVRRLEDDRKHISRELHDEAGQVLIGLKLRLQVLEGLLTDDQDSARAELSTLRTHLNDATNSLKDLAKRLRPPTLDQLGFEATLRQLLAEYRKQVDFQIAFEIEFQDEPRLESEHQMALYRIAQESLTNIVKHANATMVVVRLVNRLEGQVFQIEDNGCGFDMEEATAGLGLVGMKERVAMIGGELTIRSRLGEGTSIEVYYGTSH